MVAEGDLKSNGSLTFSIDMKDEMMTPDATILVQPHTPVSQLRWKLPSCNGFTVTFASISSPQINPPRPTSRFRVKKNGKIIYQSSIIGEPFTPFDYYKYIGGNRSFTVVYVCYSNFDIKYTDDLEITYAEEASNAKVDGVMILSYSTIKKSTTNLPNRVDVIAIE